MNIDENCEFANPYYLKKCDKEDVILRHILVLCMTPKTKKSSTREKQAFAKVYKLELQK